MSAPPSDRVISSVEMPASHRPSIYNGSKPDMARMKEHFFREGRLMKEELIRLVKEVTAVFKAEPNLLTVPAPVTVCGDTHGQFYDLLKLFDVGGDPSTTSYLFLGDYVDRGYFSIETLLYLYGFKLNYPKTFFMLRGNHECRHLTDYFTFKDECKYKYDIEVYNACCESFDALPLAAVMNEQFFCIHGGLSPDIATLDEVREISRFVEPPQAGALCDLLWSDPMEDYESDEEQEFEFNSARGCSYMYGYGAVCNFLDDNDLLCVLRAHEAQDDGYRMYSKSKSTGFPTVITLFSAPNYLDAYGNKGAILRYEGTTMNIRQFNSVAHPYYLPGFLNVVKWSLPFCVEKISEILFVFNNLLDDKEEEGEAIDRERIKRRIMAAGKMMTMMQTMREERETLLELRALVPNQQLPPGLIQKGPEAVRQALGNFGSVKQLDSQNEMMPNVDVETRKEETVRKLERRNTQSHDNLHKLRRQPSIEAIPSLVTEKVDKGK